MIIDINLVELHPIFLQVESGTHESDQNDFIETPPIPLNTAADPIIGGKVAKRGQFPWQVAIMYKQSNSLRLRCGGTLIHEHWVLTAAYCVCKF